MKALLLDAVLYVALIAGLAYGGRAQHGPARFLRPKPLLTIAVLVVTGLCNLAQFFDPDLLTRFQRIGTLLTAGQWWRLATPLLFQDGGVVGTIFNLVSLCLIGAVAEHLFSRWQWFVLYAGTGLAGEIIAYTLLPHQGSAGNSVAVIGLAAGILVAALVTQRRRLVIVSILGILAGIALLASGDLHGAAFLVGLIIALLLIGLGPKWCIHEVRGSSAEAAGD